MTPERFGLWATAISTFSLILLRVASWVSKTLAARTADRRTETQGTVDTQAAMILDLRTDADRERKARRDSETDCEGRIAALEVRVQQAERDRAQMEGVLYRMGWEKTDRGWRRNGEPKP